MKKNEQNQATARREFLGAVAAGAAAIGLAAFPVQPMQDLFWSIECMQPMKQTPTNGLTV